MANKTITQLDAAQSLNDNMVIAVQDTNTTYKTTLADVKAYCGGGGEQVKAVNNTGSAISEGDKVWINESNGSYSIEKLKEVKNFNVNGNPTINGSTGAISDFSSSNYLTLNDGFFPENNSWEYVVHFKTGNNISADQSGVFIVDSLFIGDGGNVRYLASFLQSTPSSWDIANGFLIMPISVTTEYWIKLEFTGTAYNYYSSPDGGESWSLVKSINSTSKIYGYTIPTIGTSGAHTLQFLGEIYIKDCYIKVNNELWWQPYLQTITPDAQTGIAAENITAGSTGLVNVASGV